MRKFSLGDVCSVTGLAESTFKSWTQHGYVLPDEPSAGVGNFHYYSMSQCVAAAVAQRCKEAMGRISPGMVRSVFSVVGGSTEAQLRASFDAGRCYWVPGADRLIAMDTDAGVAHLNVATALAQVQNVAANYRTRRAGRTTALAAV